ncbi:hypothetical protein ABEW50_00035 [Paenibacillus jamilae]|uniref:Lipoprotein n=1 Tax=Paenibacillus alvei TaxID=44250 RepID=A0ABT4E8H1_PAEAL|nr:hypothetical protein [Paenibacillus alvei]MCY9530037.1 hypothetical protein [Paenibacillus alvei]
MMEQKAKKKSSLTYLVIGVLLIILAVTNPNKDDFTDYVSKKADANHFVASVAFKLLGMERDNYIFFSKFSFYNVNGDKVIVYGLLNGVFFSL